MTDTKKNDSLDAVDLENVSGGFGFYRGYGGFSPYAYMRDAVMARYAMNYAYGPRAAYYNYGPRPAYYWYSY